MRLETQRERGFTRGYTTSYSTDCQITIGARRRRRRLVHLVLVGAWRGRGRREHGAGSAKIDARCRVHFDEHRAEPRPGVQPRRERPAHTGAGHRDRRCAASRPAIRLFTGFPVLDSMGSVNLSDDGDGKPCLFVVNAGSNTVSSFRVGPDGLELADQKPSGGSRPASLTSNSRGGSKQVLYVLNSDNATASFRGFNVSVSCVLTQIPGSDRALPSQASVPATIRFDERGRHLAVSERFAPAQPAGSGDIVVYPVDSNGLTGTPAVTPSPERTPYGLDYNHHDILSVTNEAVDATALPERHGLDVPTAGQTGRSCISTPSPRRAQRAGTCSRTTASSSSSPIRPGSSCPAAPTCCLSPSTTTAR